MSVTSLEHLTTDEQGTLDLVNQIGAGPAIVISHASTHGGLSRDFIASLHPQVLLETYRTAEPGELRDRVLQALLASDDPLLDWYVVLRELCRPGPKAIVIEAYDEGETPEPKTHPAVVAVYEKLGLPNDVRQGWEALLNGRTGENSAAVVSRLASTVADSAAGIALLLSQLNTGPSSPAWHMLDDLASHQTSDATPLELLLGVYSHRPWPDSSAILVAAVGHCASRTQLKRVIATGAGNAAVVAAAAKLWPHLPEQLPTNTRTKPVTPET